MDIRAIDELNNTVREETFGTIMTDGSSPKHNNRVLEIEMGGSCHIRQATKEGVIECMLPGIADLEYPNSTTRRGRTQEKGQICPTITTENIPNVLEEWTWEVDGVKYLIRIRKLTPRECGRLMGVSDHDIDKILDVNSNTQAYKQFGNSIVVDVMENIFREMIPDFPMNPPIGD